MSSDKLTANDNAAATVIRSANIEESLIVKDSASVDVVRDKKKQPSRKGS